MTDAIDIKALYYIRLKDQNGVEVARFDHFSDSTRFSHRLNDVGDYEFSVIDDGDSRIDLFELDGQVEFWRSIPGLGLDWYIEFESFHRTINRELADNGVKTFKSIGFDYNDLLRRTTIAYKGGTIRADKNEAAETAMITYTEENCGPTADDTVVGRLYIGGYPNFSVATTTEAGSVWTGSKPGENLLDVLQDIANYSGIDFKVNNNGDAAFIFQTYPDQMGLDRTNIGFDPFLGANAAGNIPMIFSTELGNIASISYEYNRQQEGNVIVVWGKGDMSTRTTVTRSDGERIDDSQWNRCEISRSGGSYDEDYETHSLNTMGDEELESNKPKVQFEFQPLQQESSRYGIHYNIGDRVTINEFGVERHQKIIGADISFENNAERVVLTMADIPTRQT